MPKPTTVKRSAGSRVTLKAPIRTKIKMIGTMTE